MDYWDSKYNKSRNPKKQKKRDYEIQNNDKQSSIDKETLNLFKGIVKIKTKDKKVTEDNNDNKNNIFDFANDVYNDEEHLYSKNNQITTNKKSNNNSIVNNNNNTSGSILHFYKNRVDTSNSSIDIWNFPKGKNMKKTVIHKSPRKLLTNIRVKRTRRSSIIGNSTNKNKYNRDCNIFLKLKEKEKIPSKTPYLDNKLKNNTNNNKIHKDNTNIYNKTKTNYMLNPKKQKSNNIKPYILSTGNIKRFEKKENEDNKKKEDKKKKEYNKEKEDNKENEEKNDEEKIEKGTNKSDEGNKKNIQNNKEIKKTNIILNILNKPFFCCFKS